MAADLDYVAFPPAVVSLIEDSWRQNIKDASGKPVWTGPSS
jgi:phosphate transport system substrate-binding protein